MTIRIRPLLIGLAAALALGLLPPGAPENRAAGIASAAKSPRPKRPPHDKRFHLVEATIADIQKAIKRREITCEGLVHLYLDRIKAYGGTCVNQPDGILGVVSTIPPPASWRALDRYHDHARRSARRRAA
jgi:hypothetical protein